LLIHHVKHDAGPSFQRDALKYGENTVDWIVKICDTVVVETL